MDFITLRRAALAVVVCTLGTFYQGSRFDWNAIVRSVDYQGNNYVDTWFSNDDPKHNEHVCGPAEVFSPIGFDEAKPGETFFLPGVGLLIRPDQRPYTQFGYYEFADRGECTTDITGTKVIFTQKISGIYKYVKTIELIADNAFKISHVITNLGDKPFVTDVYCHNFFTMGTEYLPKGREIVVPFEVKGSFTRENDFVTVDGNIFRITRDCTGRDMVNFKFDEFDTVNNYSFEVREGSRSVSCISDRPLSDIAYWNNAKVSCYEPYLDINIAPGESYDWSMTYTLK